MFQTVSCRPLSAKSLLRRTNPSSVRPVSAGLAGMGMMANGFMVEMIRFNSSRSSSGRGLLKHLCCSVWISVGERIES